MKEHVFNIDDLQEFVPLFNGHLGHFIGKRLLRWLKVEQINELYRRNMDVQGVQFTDRILKDPLVGVRYQVHNEEILKSIDQSKSYIVVSNHPFGSLDGIIMLDFFGKINPNFKVMANVILTQITTMKDLFIPVRPESSPDDRFGVNINGIRLSMEHIEDGFPMGFFPAGGISIYNKETHLIQDKPWALRVMRFIRAANVPIIPVFFDGSNSKFFHWLGKIDWRIRNLAIPSEVFNKRGQVIDLYLGSVITPEKIQSLKTAQAIGDYLYKESYSLVNRSK